MSVKNFIETRHIALPKGGELVVDITREFLSRVRQHFNLNAGEYVTDEQIRMFMWGSIKSAIDKATEE